MDIETRNRLVVENRGLVFKTANHYSRYLRDNATSLEDLEQIGMIGLIVAAERFDPARGWQFSTYAMWWIRHHIQRATVTAGTIRRGADPKFQAVKPHSIKDNALRKQAVISLDEPKFYDGAEWENTLLDYVPSPDNTEREAINRLECERILAAMPPHYAALLREWMHSGKTQREVSEDNGYSRSLVHHVLTVAKQREKKAGS